MPGFSYQTLIHVKDRPTADGQPHTVQLRRVSPDYFKTMQIALAKGRAFDERDVATQPHVAIVSRQFAARLMADGDPIGRLLLRTSSTQPPITVVGIAEDALDVSAAELPEPTLYLPWAQNNNFGVPVAFVIRTVTDPAAVLPGVRDVVARIDPGVPIRKPQLLDVFVAESTAPERFRTVVLGIVAMLGLVLAAVGIAGVTYRGVIDRSKEFAVRMALGSQPGAVVAMVLRESSRDLLIGAIAGVAGGAALCALLARMLGNGADANAVTTAAAIAMLAAAGFSAALLPALRVRRVQPAAVLRS